MQRRSERIANRKAGRPGEQAADQCSSPLGVLVEERDREGVSRSVSRHLSDDGGSPNPQGRLSLDVAVAKSGPANSGIQHRLLSPKANISIGTWNVRTLHQEGRTELFIREIQRYKWDIIGLSETHWTGSGTKTVEGYNIIFSGHQDKHISGVALLLSKNARQAMIAMQPISSRIIYARFQGQGFNLAVIQVYAPTADSSENDIQDFYDNLQKKVDEIDRRDILMIMGDWNAKIGTDRETWPSTIGQYGFGVANERGQRLLEFCCTNQLCITNTYFKHKDSRKWTWAHPNGQSYNMIDFIIINKRWKNCVLDSRSFPSADAGSDHQLVMCKMRLKLKCGTNNGNQLMKKHDIGKLKDQNVLNRYQQEVADKLQQILISNDQTLNQTAECFSATIKAAADNVLGFARSRKKPWISNSTLDLTDKRRHIKGKLAEAPNLKPTYNRLTREIPQSINNDYEKWCNDNCNQLELQNTHQTHSLHKKIKELTKGVKVPTKSITIKDKSGTILTTEEEVRNRWKEYCSDLYNYDINPNVDALGNLWMDQQQDPEPDISTSEVEAAIRKLKPRKAPGVDGVCGELIQHGGVVVSSGLQTICQRAWNKEAFPEIWTKSIIITIWKKGDLQLCENYRTISLVVHASKVLLEIISLEDKTSSARLPAQLYQ